MDDPKKVLIIGYVWPEPDSSAAGSRMMQLISIFNEQDWEITFATAAAESDHRADLEEYGVDSISVEINSSNFDEFLKELRPDIVMFDRFVTEEQFGWRVAHYCPDALRILDTEDLHCLRRTRHKAVKENKSFNKMDLVDEEVAKREIASMYRSDLTLIISEVEVQLLKDVFRIDDSLLHYLPFLLEELGDARTRQWKNFEKRNHFVTIGNFRHEPNMDGVKYLKKTIWPLIRKELPEAGLHIYGSYPTKEALDFHKPKEGFFVKGRAENAEEVVGNARVLLAPLRFGAGLKGKLIEAMQCGTPSVTTTIGAEGINGEMSWPGVISDEPEAFAEAAVNLYKDQKEWERAQQQGAKIINTRFLKKHFEDELIQIIGEIGDNLKKHRQKNFTGQMLLHHTMKSTEFMSRWIEEKNK